MTQEKIEAVTNWTLASIMAVFGSMSMLDIIQQLGQIVLIGISCLSGFLLVMKNWDSGIRRFKKFFKKGR